MPAHYLQYRSILVYVYNCHCIDCIRVTYMLHVTLVRNRLLTVMFMLQYANSRVYSNGDTQIRKFETVYGIVYTRIYKLESIYSTLYTGISKHVLVFDLYVFCLMLMSQLLQMYIFVCASEFPFPFLSDFPFPFLPEFPFPFLSEFYSILDQSGTWRPFSKTLLIVKVC